MDAKFIKEAKKVIKRYSNKIYLEFFGVSLEVTLDIWNYISKAPLFVLKENHLLWTLYFLKVYPTENVASGA
jgi:hypothetical protein